MSNTEKQHHVPMRLWRATALASMILLAATATASTHTETHTGEGTIECQYSLPLARAVCHGSEFAGESLQTDANVRRVSFTLEWAANSIDSEELDVLLRGNTYACQTGSSDQECTDARAIGRSPLTVTLEGLSVEDTTINAWISPKEVCKFDRENAGLLVLVPTECDTKLFYLVQDQTYTYTWTIEREASS